MHDASRRTFVGLMAAAVPGAAVPGAAGPQGAGAASEPTPEPDPHARLTAALREWNAAAELGITPDELDRASAYATGALLEAQARLRTLELAETLELPVHFEARRSPR